MITEYGSWVVAVLFIYAIYKGLNAGFSTFPESDFRSFMISSSGRVLVGFVSIILFWIILIYVMVGMLGIHC